MTDQLNITLRIADCNPIALRIPRPDEESFRSAEHNVNRLRLILLDRYPDMSSQQILALVALQFARLSSQKQADLDDLLPAVQEVDDALSRLLEI